MKHIILLISLLSTFAATAQQRKVHQLDLAHILSRVTTPGEFGLNKEYQSIISRPFEYYGDFYGVQILQNLSVNDMVKELRPSVVTDSTLVLSFETGVATLYYNRDISIMGIVTPHNHVVFEGDTFKEFLGVKDAFLCFLIKNKLADKYLIPNPYHDKELLVEKMMKSNHATTLLPYQKEEFSTNDNALLIYPDKVHGDLNAFNEFLSFLENADLDWLGIEMLGSDMQQIANDYIFSEDESEQFLKAKDSIEKFYSTGWIEHFKVRPKTIDDNPFIRLFQLMRNRRIPIYGLDGSNTMYILFRNGETQFGAAVRNVSWAEASPNKGRGVIFGGSAHFNSTIPINYQDFIEAVYPGIYKYYIIR